MDAVLPFVTSLGTYVRIVVVGVWFPGFIIFCEFAYLYFRYTHPTEKPLVTYAAEQLKELDSAVITAFIVLFVLAASVIIGYVARDLMFAASDFWLRRGWPPTRTLAEILSQIREVYGAERVDKVTANYPVFGLASIAGAPESAELPRQPETYVREFSKLWLRAKSPNFSTEGLEVEINMVMGLIFPAVLSAFVFLAAFRGVLGAILSVVSIASAIFMFYRVNWARNIETEQAIVNFLFAHWEKLMVPNSAPTP